MLAICVQKEKNQYFYLKYTILKQPTFWITIFIHKITRRGKRYLHVEIMVIKRVLSRKKISNFNIS